MSTHDDQDVIFRSAHDFAVDRARTEGEAAGAAKAVPAARAEGEAAGFAKSQERFAAIVADKQLAASPALMKAAIDMASRAPIGMDGADIVGFVSSHMKPASTASAESSPASLKNRAVKSSDGGEIDLMGSFAPGANVQAGWKAAFDRVASGDHVGK